MSDRLIAAYKRWSDLTFPHGSARDEVDEVHAEIATIDMWVTDYVVPYVEHGKSVPVTIDVKAAIDQALKRVDELQPDAHLDDKELLENYQRYLLALSDVFAVFQEES